MFRKTVFITFLWTAILFPYSNASTCNQETYVSRKHWENLRLRHSRSTFFAQQTQDTRRIETTEPLKLKNPNVAFFYAFVPGFFVHGAGHFYAREKKTGWILVAGEIVSLGVLTFSGLVGFAEAMGGEASTSPDMLALTGTIIFIGTWVYDLIGAPIAVKRNNQMLLEKRNEAIQLVPGWGSDFVGLRIVKGF
ncbi:MAG: hypothetical protein GTO24_18685 [candidate division Zixibacteria bacterium]|nr:hypothetical protein [candidate division Zixibacteria bacterium]